MKQALGGKYSAAVLNALPENTLELEIFSV